MKVKRISWFFSLTLFSWGMAFAQETEHTMGLKEMLRYGLDNSIAIRQSVLDQQQAEYQVGEVKSSGLPQVSGEGQFQNFPNRPTQLLPGEIVNQPGTQIPVQFGTDYTMSGTIKASQLIYNHQFLTGLRAAKSSTELYSLLKIKTEEDVIYQVSNAYYQALQLQAQVHVLDSNMNMLSQLTELTRLQYESDMVTKTDYSRVVVNKTNLSTQLQSLRTSYEQQKNYLKVLIGMPMEENLELQPSSTDNDITLASLQNQKQDPVELEILEKQKALNVLNKKSIQAGYVPSLAFFGQQQWQAQRNEFNFFDSSQPWFQQTVIGLQLQVPIFDGLQKHYKMQQSKIEIDKLSLQQTNTKRQLDMQFENAREQLTNSLASVEAQRENRELAHEVYDQTQLLYKEQVAGLTELLDAERAYREAQTNYYNEVIKFRRAELDVLKAQGQLKTIIN